MTLQITLDPWHVEMHADGLGRSDAWLRAGKPDKRRRARRASASSSPRATTTPKAACSACSTRAAPASTSKIPRKGATYNRITILAITDSNELPSPAEGVNRLVVTKVVLSTARYRRSK